MCENPCPECKALIAAGQTPACPKLAVASLPATVELEPVLTPEAQAELDARETHRLESAKHAACGEY